jgi:UDP-4-amino-4,6-dideoxy-N-acetyl-beta-L-altrosamine transaminase
VIVARHALAVDGGRPVRDRMLPYGRQTIDEADVARVVEVLRSDWLTTGPAVAAFEQAFAAAVAAREAVAVSSGTAALHAAVFAAGIGPGDEVITTPMTFAASANAVRYQGATVVFADVHRDTLNIDSEDVRRRITPKTRAILPVDFSGLPADLDDLSVIAAEHGLTVIEDAAHALGATYRGRPVGSASTMTTFSLHPVKHITSGEGGVVTTNDSRLAERLRLFRNHGIATDHRQRQREGSWQYQMVELGFNYRLTDLQSALAESQLEKANVWLARREAIAAAYTSALGGRTEMQCPTVLADRRSAWHLYVIRLNLDTLRVGRADVFRALRAENIGVNVHYIPVPWHPYYEQQGYVRGSWPIAESEYERLISLPMWPGMNDQDVSDTIAAVGKVMDAYAA